MSKQKNPNKKFVAIMPWVVDSDGSKYIEIADGYRITPDTAILNSPKSITSLVTGKNIEVISDKEGLLFYGETDELKVDNNINSMSYSVKPEDDKNA